MMTINELLNNPSLVLLLITIGIGIIEWLIPFPFFIRPRLVIPYFSMLGDRVNKPTNSDKQKKISSILMTLIVVIPVITLYFAVKEIINDKEGIYIGALTLIFILESRPYRSLINTVYKKLNNDKNEVKDILNKFCLRETGKLSPMGLIKATIECTSLRVFNSFYVPLFYALIFNIECALIIKCLILLSEAFNFKLFKNAVFGRLNASIANAIYILPSFALIIFMMIIPFKNKNKTEIIRSLNTYVREWPNKSSGLFLAYMAGMLNIRLGGPRYYEGVVHRYPHLGGQNEPEINDLKRAKNVISLAIWVSILTIVAIKALFIIWLG